MPLQKCVVDGKKGWQWGSEGKCYTGKDAKKQAVKQGIAIEGPEKFSEKAREAGVELSQKEIEVVADWMYNEGYTSTAIVARSALLFFYWAKSDRKKKKDDSEAKHDSGMKPQNYEKGGPVCPKDHVFDKKTEKCVPKDGVEVDSSSAIYEGYRTTSMVMDRDGYGHFHTFKPGDKYTSKARTSFGDIIVSEWGSHVHEIRDGKVIIAEKHVHDIKDIGPGQEWFNV